MRNKLYPIAFALILMLASCQRACLSFQKDIQTSERNYEVIMFSGGDTVYTDRFEAILNDSKESDGMYYYKGDTLIEISGDYVIKSVK